LEVFISAGSSINKNVFFSSVFFIFITTVFASIFPKEMKTFFKEIQTWLVTHTGWVYILAVGVMLFVAVWLITSRLGDIKLGPDHSAPDYSNISWFAMLFSAGMGVGLMFWGVAEPMMHFLNPPVGDGSTIESAKEAMKITMFHWGLHAWAIYATLGVVLCYFCYRKGLPLLPRSAFYPILGEKIYGKIGDAIDSCSIIGTMFGVAASLGMGVMQVNGGLNYVFDLPQSTTVQAVLIAIITGFATISVVLGLDGGIKKLSNINMILAVGLMLSILVLGDTVALLRASVQNTGAYLSDIVETTFNLYTYEKKENWIGGWTLLYWAWWISWSPFVGMFIARISKGRTIREFMIGVLFVPSGFTFLWMTVFGNSGINLVLQNNATELAEAVNSNVAVALFKFFEYFPASTFLSVLGIMLVVTFFVSSSDSGSLVIDTLASGGAQEPPVWQRVFWAITEGIVAATLLLAGGIEALQTMTIVSALPIMILIFIGLYCFIKSLRADHLLLSSVQGHSSTVQYAQATVSWKERLLALTSKPKKEVALNFISTKVEPALTELKNEMESNGLTASLFGDKEHSFGLVVKNGEVEDFRYEVKIRSFEVPEYVEEDHDIYYRAEVFLLNGGQDYDIYGYTTEQIIADAVTQYEKHFHYLHVANSEVVH
jgi:choline/glycine/proline betaine transport protein